MLTIVLLFCAVALALAFAAFNYASVKKMPEGTERMSEIASAIRVGANAFINYEYRILAIVVGTIAAVMAIVTTWHAAVALLLGSFMSASAGFIGMKIATYANVRVSNKAKESRSIGATVKVAFQGGSVMGLCVAGCALLGLFIVYLVFGLGLGQLSVTEGSYTNLLGLTFTPFPMRHWASMRQSPTKKPTVLSNIFVSLPRLKSREAHCLGDQSVIFLLPFI